MPTEPCCPRSRTETAAWTVLGGVAARGATGVVGAGSFPFGDQIIAFDSDGSHDWGIRTTAIFTVAVDRDAVGNFYTVGLTNDPIRIGTTEVPTSSPGPKVSRLEALRFFCWC